MVGDTGHCGCDGGGKDDATTVGYVLVGGLGDEKLCTSVEREDTVVVFLGDVFFRLEDFGAGVGDDHIDAAEVGKGFGEELGDRGRRGDVGLDGYGFGTVRFDFGDDLVGC